MTQSRLGISAALGLLSLLLMSCTPPPPMHQVSDAVGRTLSDVAGWLKEERALIILDVSPRVGVDSRFTSADSGSAWTIVAACASAAEIERSDELEVAVIPSAEVTYGVRAAIDAGTYSDAVHCENGRAYR